MNFTITKKLITSITLLSLHLVSISSFALAEPVPAEQTRPLKVSQDGSRCSIDTGSGQRLADKLATLGQNTGGRALLPVRKSTLNGLPVEYVSSRTGELSFAVTDLSFSDASPLLFQRYYSSGNGEDIGLGRGWSFSYNDKISVSYDTAVLTTSAGETFEFVGKNHMLDKKTATMRFTPKIAQPIPTQSFQYDSPNKIVEESASYKKTFTRFGEDFYLTNVKLSTGDEINIYRSANGRIAKITDEGNYIQFNWADKSEPRLLSIFDKANRQVWFNSNRGQLKKVKSVSGGIWKYSYEGEKLAEVENPMNNLELKVQYDAKNRVVKTSNEISFKRYMYKEYGDSQATTVTNSENYLQTFEHNSKGLVNLIYDQKGTIGELRYDESNRLISIKDASNVIASFKYDSEGRLVRQQMPDQTARSFTYDSKARVKSINENGVKTRISYDSNGVVRERKSTVNGNTVSAKFNKSGKVDFVRTSGTNIRFEYDSRGNEKAKTVSDEGRYETIYDVVGRKTAEKFPNGNVIKYRYNAASKVVKISDKRQKELRAEYDASDLLTRVYSRDGWIRVLRDKAGRVIRIENSTGQTREFSYNSSGSLVRFKNARGETVQFYYTPRGKMKRVVKSNGRVIDYRLDQNENAVGSKRYWLNKRGGEVFRNIAFRENRGQDDTIFSCVDLGLADDFGSLSSLSTSVETTSYPLDSCGDPFDPFGGGALTSSFGSFFGEDCDTCIQRQRANCESSRRACLLAATAVAAGLYSACTGTGPGFLAGVALVAAAHAAMNAACMERNTICLRNVRSSCPKC